MGAIPTVKVKADTPTGSMIINKSDLTSKHVLIVDEKSKKPSTKTKKKEKEANK